MEKIQVKMHNWYFVSKIVLTYCFYNLFLEVSQFWYIRTIRIQIGKNYWNLVICRKSWKKFKVFSQKNGKLKSKYRLCLLNHQTFLLFFFLWYHRKCQRYETWFQLFDKMKASHFYGQKSFCLFSGYLVHPVATQGVIPKEIRLYCQFSSKY